MMADTKVRSGRKAFLAAGLEVLLWTVAVVFLGTALWTVADGYLYQLRAQGTFLRAPIGRSPDPAGGRAVGGGGSATGEGAVLPADRPRIALETPIARLEIPRLGLSVMVAEGISARVLRQAVGHLPASARPGEGGNIALAGHRDRHFRPLSQVEVGDRILLESGVGRQTFVVEWTSVVEPSQVEVLAPTDYEALTLVTCYPFWWLGHAPQRYIVRARAVEEPAPLEARLEPAEAASSGAPSAGGSP